MTEKAMEPFGLALKDYYDGKEHVSVIFHRDDGLLDDMLIKPYFRGPSEFSIIENKALDLCKGKILDLGAGVGPHSLELQKRNFDVIAIDISPHACEIMVKRGVNNVQCSSIYNLKMANLDTILLLGRAIGFVETLDGMKHFLSHCKSLFNNEGIILFDSLDVRITKRQDHLDYQERNRKLGRYIGEIGCQMEYKSILGEKFQILHIDPDALNTCALETGWNYEIVYMEETGHYLAKLY